MLYDVVSDALHAVIRRKRALIRALCLPFVIYIMLENLVYLDPPGIVQTAIYILEICIGLLIAITTHRVILLGPESIPSFGIKRISRREARYFVYLLLWYLILVPLMFLSMAPGIGIIFLIASFWLCGRLALVFPGVAIDDDISFRRSWTLTSGHGFAMWIIVGFLPAAIALALGCVYSLPFGPALGAIATVVVGVFEVAALSMAYWVLTASSGSLHYRKWSDVNP